MFCDSLVHGKTNRTLKNNQTSCKDNCQICNLICREDVHDTGRRDTYKPATDVTCRTRNVVYAILCTKCQSTIYVGETERELQARVTEHLRDIRLRKDKPINAHFGKHGHIYRDVAVAVMEKCFGAERIERQIREGLWIKRLETVYPGGCNVKDSQKPLKQYIKCIMTPDDVMAPNDVDFMAPYDVIALYDVTTSWRRQHVHPPYWIFKI